jgi:hypothetical protein
MKWTLFYCEKHELLRRKKNIFMLQQSETKRGKQRQNSFKESLAKEPGEHERLGAGRHQHVLRSEDGQQEWWLDGK